LNRIICFGFVSMFTPAPAHVAPYAPDMASQGVFTATTFTSGPRRGLKYSVDVLSFRLYDLALLTALHAELHRMASIDEVMILRHTRPADWYNTRVHGFREMSHSPHTDITLKPLLHLPRRIPTWLAQSDICGVWWLLRAPIDRAITRSQMGDVEGAVRVLWGTVEEHAGRDTIPAHTIPARKEYEWLRQFAAFCQRAREVGESVLTTPGIY